MLFSSPVADLHARRLALTLIELGHRVRDSSQHASGLRQRAHAVQDAAEGLDAWLWLWETQGGAQAVADHGDVWLLPVLRSLTFSWKGLNAPPVFTVRRPGLPLHSSVVWPTEAEDLEDLQKSEEMLETAVARFETHFQERHAFPVTARESLELFHWPMLLLLAARQGERAEPQGTVLTGYDYASARATALGVLLEQQDAVMTRWWVDDPSYSPDRLESYQTSGGKHLLDAHLTSPEWIALWLAKGLSPHGAPGTPVARSPLFQTSSVKVAEHLLAAGVDPDTRDERGTLAEEPREGYGRPLASLHELLQKARANLNRPDSVKVAQWRDQFTQLIQTSPRGVGNSPTDPAFRQALRKGPAPVWEGAQGQTMGLLEWLARADSDGARWHLHQLLDTQRRWDDERLGPGFRQAHHGDGVPDWAIAHVLTNGLLPKQTKGAGAAKDWTRPLSPLLPPSFNSDDLGHLLQAWAIHGAGRMQAAASLWTDLSERRELYAAEHVPVALRLIDRALEEASAHLAMPSFLAPLAAALWDKTQDEGERARLWSLIIVSPELDKDDPDGVKPYAQAWAAQTPALWLALEESVHWERHQRTFSLTLLDECVAHIRAARHQSTPLSDDPIRRARLRHRS